MNLELMRYEIFDPIVKILPEENITRFEICIPVWQVIFLFGSHTFIQHYFISD